MRRVQAVTVGTLLVVLIAACSSGGPARDTAGTATRRPTSATSPTGSTTVNSGKATRAAATRGCGVPADVATIGAEAPGDVASAITVDGVERTYRLGIPTAYDPDEAAPVVMNLHGSGSTALQASVYGGVTREADERGFISITPDAIDGKWQLGGSGADHDFLLALVDDVEARYCVDRDRVFLIGMSLGAWKAAATACAAAPVFAAIALVAVEVHPDDCPPIPTVAFHGTDDAVVPYGEGSGKTFPKSPNAGLPGTHENLAAWARGNDCDPKPAVKRIGADVERWSYRNCTADLDAYTVFGAGHTWPGADIEIGATTQTIDATQIAFDWFAAHPRSRAR